MWMAPKAAAARVGATPPRSHHVLQRADRRQDHRQAQLLAQDLAARVDLLDVAQHARAEGQRVDGDAVAHIGRLRLGAAHQVVPGAARDVAPRRLHELVQDRVLQLLLHSTNPRVLHAVPAGPRGARAHHSQRLRAMQPTSCSGLTPTREDDMPSRWSDRRKRFRGILAGSACVHPASVHDAVSARIAADLGFELGMFAGSVASLAGAGSARSHRADPQRVRRSGLSHRPGGRAAAPRRCRPWLRQCAQRHAHGGGAGECRRRRAVHRGHGPAARLSAPRMRRS